MCGRPSGARTRYRDVNAHIFALYEAGQHREALDVLESARVTLKPWAAELAYLEACLRGTLGDRQGAITALQRGVDQGAWWDPEVLTGDDDLAGLRGMPVFAEIIGVAATRWQRNNTNPDRSGDVLVEPTGKKAVALLVALHGAEEDADDAVEQWGTATESSAAVLGIRSSQRVSPQYRTWPDASLALTEIEDALVRLPERLRPLPVVAAGFSAGGRVALSWALSGTPQTVAGVIAVAPAVSTRLIADLPALDQRLRPAQLLVGEQDTLLDAVTDVAERLVDSGFVLEVVPGCGHEFPRDFPRRLSRLLTELAE